MRVGLVSQWFPPETGSAALPLNIARTLASSGHDVKVLTGVPNYPSGRVHPGYRVRPHFREQIDGIDVHRLPLVPTHDSSPSKRILNYSTFALSAALGATIILRDVDAVWVHGTPATAGFPAMMLRRMSGIPFIYHMQDLWPETVTASGLVSPAVAARLGRPLHIFCDALYARAAHVAVIAPGMVEAVRARGVPEAKVSFIPNWADESIFAPTPRDPALRQRLMSNRGLLVMYAGAVGDAQGLDTLVDAAIRLRERRDIGFVVVGDGTRRQALEDATRSHRLDNIVFIPPQGVEEMPSFIAAADAQLICLRDLPLFRMTLPSKLQSALASGTPIITSAAGDVADVTQAADAGLIARPERGDELAAAVSAMADATPGRRARWGRNARIHYERYYSRDRGASAMNKVLQMAVSESQ